MGSATQAVDYTCPDCDDKGEYRCSDRHRGYYTCEMHGDYTVDYYA